MVKDKEWLKEETYKLYPEHSEMYGSPDCLTVETVSLVDSFIKLIDQLDEPEKPVVPQFVATWIKRRKKDFKNGFDAARYINEYGWDDETHLEYKVFGWLKSKERLFIQVFEDGYEIEGE